MVLLSVVVFARGLEEIQDILDQDLSRAEIILCTPRAVSYTQPLPPQVKFLSTEDIEPGAYENEALRLATGRYAVFRYPGECWKKDFLRGVVDFLVETPLVLHLHYLQGFYRTEKRPAHVFEINPGTRRPFAIHKIFRGADYFVPGIKILYPLALIRTYRLQFDEDIRSVFLRQAVFGVEFCAALYEAAHFVTLPVHRITTTFEVPLAYLKPNQSEAYCHKLADKLPVFQRTVHNTVGLVAWSFWLRHTLRYGRKRASRLTGKVV